MDWVEVFAPVVFEPNRPRSWPATASLLLDDLPFRVRDPDTGRFTKAPMSSARRCGVEVRRGENAPIGNCQVADGAL